MLLGNLSAVCMLNVVTYRYIIIRYPLFQINNRKRKRITFIGMLVSIFFSITSFIFYGETTISVRFQNVTVSGTVCGISDNGIFFSSIPNSCYDYFYCCISLFKLYTNTFDNIILQRTCKNGEPQWNICTFKH